MSLILCRMYTIFIMTTLYGCAVGDNTRPEPDTKKDQALRSLATVADKAQSLESAALALESLVDEGRRRISNGEPRSVVIADIEMSLNQIKSNHQSLQQTIQTVQHNLHLSDKTGIQNHAPEN